MLIVSLSLSSFCSVPGEFLETLLLLLHSLLLIPRTDESISPIHWLQGYYRAAHALARISRQMARQLWRPATESDGIPLDVLCTFMNNLNEWREEHLRHVGVPSNFQQDWDFVSAVTACEWCFSFLRLFRFGLAAFNYPFPTCTRCGWISNTSLTRIGLGVR